MIERNFTFGHKVEMSIYLDGRTDDYPIDTFVERANRLVREVLLAEGLQERMVDLMFELVPEDHGEDLEQGGSAGVLVDGMSPYQHQHHDELVEWVRRMIGDAEERGDGVQACRFYDVLNRLT